MNTDVCATPSIVQLAKDGDTEGVWKLLQKEEDVNARNFIGQTALHKAATGKYLYRTDRTNIIQTHKSSSMGKGDSRFFSNERPCSLQMGDNQENVKIKLGSFKNSVLEDHYARKVETYVKVS